LRRAVHPLLNLTPLFAIFPTEFTAIPRTLSHA
jgi:hypothetical protein